MIGPVVLIQSVLFILLDSVIVRRVYKKRKNSPTKSVFSSFCVVTLIMQCCSFFALSADYGILVFPKLILHLINTGLLVGMCGTGYYWFRYLFIPSRGYTNDFASHFVFAIPLLTYLVMCLLSPWTHWIFFINDSLAYQRGSLFVLQFIFPYLYMVLALVIFLYYKLRGRSGELENSFVSFYLFSFAAISGPVLQVGFNIDGGYTEIGISVGLILMYLEMYVEDSLKLETLEKTQEINKRLQQANTDLQAQMDKVIALNTELEENRRTLEEARTEAERANKAKTAFLFNMSHDIRTPMNAIIGFTNLLEKHWDEPERRRDYMTKIKDSSSLLLSIINNILEMSKIERGAVELDEKPTDTCELFGSIQSLFTGLMRQKSIDFSCTVNVVRDSFIYCDAQKIKDVMINLISNAYKYTDQGGKVAVIIDELPHKQDGWVYLRTTIADTGRGMSEEFLPHLFEEFSREYGTEDVQIEGTGLGMPIVKSLVEFMNGSIEVKSKKGEGTTFIVTIPHRIANFKRVETIAKHERTEERFEGRRILVTEDNELNCEITCELLSDAGFVVEAAGNGLTALEMITREPADYYDLVLMDVHMPVMNGYEAVKAIRALPDPVKASLPIIATTANAFEEDRRNAFEAGMNGHIAKPINVDSLIECITGLLGSEGK